MLETVLDRLQTKHMTVRPYAGRCMTRGTLCVGVVLDKLADLAVLGPELRPGLKVDSLGRQFIAYRPDILLPADHELVTELREQDQ